MPGSFARCPPGPDTVSGRSLIPQPERGRFHDPDDESGPRTVNRNFAYDVVRDVDVVFDAVGGETLDRSWKVLALLIAARPFWPRASTVGSVLAVGMFLTTLSFLVTTPGVWEPSAGGFPALSALPGQFLIKDLALLGISFWTLGEAWHASEQVAA